MDIMKSTNKASNAVSLTDTKQYPLFFCLPNKHVPLQLMAANSFSHTRSNSQAFSMTVPHLSINQPSGTTWANRAPAEEEEVGEGSGIFSTWPWRHIFLLPSRHRSPGNISSKAAWEKCLESQTDSLGKKKNPGKSLFPGKFDLG